MSERLRIATVGAGYFSQFHYDAWSRIPEVELVAACDSDRDRGHAVARQYGIERTFTELAAMLDEMRPDLLDVITPPHTHHAIVGEAVARGVPVVCQKPLAPDLSEAQAMVRAAEDGNVLLVVHENFRFMPWYRQAKRMLDGGVLGTPHAVAFRLRPGDGQGPNAYLDRQPYFQEMERFLIHETAIHLIDTFRFLLGEATSVYAQLRRLNPCIAGEDAGYVLFDFAGCATGLFDGNRLNDHPADNCRLTMGEMILEGSSGVLRLDGYGRLWRKPHGAEENETKYDWNNHGFGADCVYHLQRHVVDHLLYGKPIENTGREYLTNLRIEEAVYESNRTGCRIELAGRTQD